MTRRAASGFALITAFLCSPVLMAEEKPLWEFGLGVGGIVFPDYRGSDETTFYPVPVPYFVYRGDLFKADRDGIRGKLFDSERVELNLSVGATIPVSSDNNAAREDMPDLRPTLELGPSIDIRLLQSADERVKLDLRLPVRIPITLESSPQSIGWVFAPRLNLDVEDVAGFTGWNFGLGAGPIVADEKHHDYFYAVAPQYATPTRPQYNADDGYSGAHVIASLSKRFPGFWVGAYVRYDTLAGATFNDSPLVKRESYVAGGFGIAWMIGESRVLVEAED